MAKVIGVNRAGSRWFAFATSATLALLSSSAPAGTAINGVAGGDSVGFQAQMQCQFKLADEAWERSIWPESNPTPKPPRQTSQPDDSIRKRVEELLRKETALATLYGVSLDTPALQAEIDRMATHTRDPDRLRALFALLGDDAAAIANCIARPLLIERRLRDAYAADRRWHGPLEQAAQSALLAGAGKAALAESGGVEMTVTLTASDDGEPPTANREPHALRLSAVEFEEARARLTSRRGLQETADAFVEQTLMSVTDDRLVVRSRVWAKQPFDRWWAGMRDVQAPASAWRKFDALHVPEIHGNATAKSSGALAWRTSPGLAPSERYYHSAVWTGSELLIWGGVAADIPLNSGGRYNPATDSWSGLALVDAPSARSVHSAVWTGSEMLIWGGSSAPSTGLNTGGRYDPANDRWTATSVVGAPSARYWHTAVWTGGEMIVWGGTATGASGLNTGARYNPVNDSWTATVTGSAAPSARFLHTAVWTGTTMIVWGGTPSAVGGVSTGGRYNPLTDAWTATSITGAPSIRFWHTAVWTGGEMIVWGGSGAPGQYWQSGGRYNPASDSWAAVSSSGAPVARNAPLSVWTGSEMIVWGGVNNGGLNTGGRYNPANDAWTPTAIGGAAPSGRWHHSLVWTGSEMIVWGGSTDGTSGTRSGGRYDPVLDRWAATSLGTDESRLDHTAIWTGNEMLVWGGSAVVGALSNSGRRYNPATDSWSAISMEGAPSARSSHTAVWTGSTMVIWGGSPGGLLTLGSGGRYNPVSDTWATTRLESAPAPRYLHTAVWSGAEMIVWGGSAEGGIQDTGARYDPTTDSWTATSRSGAPVARSLHTSVWTGAEMIVWGGRDSQGGLENTGGRYNPALNAWAATQVSDAPSARVFHTAVWTGDEMVVWGGTEAGSPFARSGGRFGFNSARLTWEWTPTTQIGAPSGRGRHSAVWTGSEVIIWGGIAGTALSFGQVNTGARYSPAGNSWLATPTSRAPSPRYSHTAVWTGNSMIVFGGCCGVGDYGVLGPLADTIFASGFEASP